MSLWYAAHIVMYVRRKEKPRAKLPVWENIVLIKADSDDEAWNKARARGMQDAGDDGGTFRWEGTPAEWVFAGIRKMTLCDDPEKRPGDGTELSFIELQVHSEKSLQGLLRGQPTDVTLDDQAESVYEPNGATAPNGVGRKMSKVMR